MLVGTNVSHTVSYDTVTRGKTRRPTQHTDRRCETSFETKTNYFIVRRWLNVPARSTRFVIISSGKLEIEKKKKKKIFTRSSGHFERIFSDDDVARVSTEDFYSTPGTGYEFFQRIFAE